MKNELGKKIKEARLDKGITQKSLAEKINVSEIMISRYELGTNRVPLKQLEKIANILGKPTKYFFENDSSNENTSSEKSKPKTTFVFDLDDTLVDGRQFCGETIARVITNLDPSANFEQIVKLHTSIRGLWIKDLYTKIMAELGIKKYDLEELLKHDYLIQHENPERMRVFEGVLEILDFLKSKNKRLVVCTNRTKSLVTGVLEANNIQSYFDEVISCVDSGYPKPNPYSLVSMMNKYKIDTSEVIYFGDSEVDSKFAENSGVDHIIFDQYMNNKNLFKKLVNMFLEG